MKRIAILLTVHNRKNTTITCLRKVFSQIMPNKTSIKVYLTNDGCTDGTPESVRKLFPEVVVIDGNGSLFWNRGMWTAWVRASQDFDYDYYMWVNDDTDLYEDCLTRLLSASASMSETAIIVGSTKPHGDSTLISYGGRDKNHKRVYPDEKQCKDIYIMTGNIVLVPKSVYKQIGMNDPVFTHALGDNDYGLRAQKMGIKVVIAPGILGECDNHKQLSAWCNPDVPFKQRWALFRTPRGINPRELFIFKKRHEGIISAIKALIGNYIRVLFPKLWNRKVYKSNIPQFG